MSSAFNTKKLTLTAMLLSLIVVLSVFEGMLPPLPFLPPGVKLGLSNTAIMYSLFFVGRKNAFFLAFLKSCFIFMTRGFTSFLLSLSGGLLSLAVMLLLLFFFKEKISYILLSVFGAVFHNIGQLIAIILFMDNPYIVSYLPVLIVFGILMGIMTGILLKFIMPAFKKIFF